MDISRPSPLEERRPLGEIVDKPGDDKLTLCTVTAFHQEGVAHLYLEEFEGSTLEEDLAGLDAAFRSLLANEGDVKILVDPRMEP